MIYLILLLVIAAIMVGAAFILTKAPRTEADWKEGLSKGATFEIDAEGLYRLDPLRAFTFYPENRFDAEWTPATLDPGALKEMWYFIEPFPANAAFAHSFLSFVFEDANGPSRTISVSIEARMEKDATYSPLRGLFRQYQLLYVWSTEKDILTRIAIGLDHKLLAYRLKLTPDQIRALFDYFVKRTNALAERPRFYNTLHSNCTNELAKAVNDAFPGALPWRVSWVLTGRSANWLHKRGFIDHAPGQDFKDTAGRADIKDLVRAHSTAPPDAFALQWRRDFNKKKPTLGERSAPANSISEGSNGNAGGET